MKLVFREGVSIQNGAGPNLILNWQVGDQTLEAEFSSLTPGILTALRSMAESGVTLQKLVNTVVEKDGWPTLYKFHAYLQTLEKASLIHRFVPNGNGPLVTLVPNSPYYRFRKQTIDPEQKYILSRFAYWHREENHFVLESPMGLAKLRWHDGQIPALILELHRPCSLLDLAEHLKTLSPKKLETVFVFLLNAALLTEVDDDGQIQEEANKTIHQWEFHDLLFHARSRNGRAMNGHGGTYRFWGQIPPLPAVKPPMSDEYIDLCRPDAEHLAAHNVSLASVMAERRSIREYDDKTPLP
ncbi:MAG: hypothetical protein HC804_10600, partial [Anaerolineae bacterium]|nr:hypothetical protein [Anaerolineae bacterium]